MNNAYVQAVEREARRLYDEVCAQRISKPFTAGGQFREEVLNRVRQMFAGDTLPRIDNPDD